MSIYIRLADRINDVYKLGLLPHTDDNGFVKIFKKLISEEEAQIAIELDAMKKTISEIQCETGVERRFLEEKLDSLSNKGIIYELIQGDEKFYNLMPFVPGILEALVGVSEDPEIARYLQDFAGEIKSISKGEKEEVIPINCKIDIKTQSVTLKELELYLSSMDKFAVMDCLCRTVNKAEGKECGHPIKDMCILTGEYVDYYVKIGNARLSTREEVAQILLNAEEEGLLHEIYPIEKHKSYFICNCCLCGCMFLELANRINQVLNYENSVYINNKLCTSCGLCIDNCPQQVFAWEENSGGIEIEEIRCISCRLCVALCGTKAIKINNQA